MFKLKERYQQANLEDEGSQGTEQALDTETQETEPKWSEDWRQRYAGEDEAKLNRLSRYATPDAAFDALFAAQDKIRSGELKQPFPTDGTEEQQKSWRESNGIPDSPEGYEVSLGELVIGENDKPFVDEYLKYAYDTNQTPEQVNTNLQWYYENLQKQQDARYEQDKVKAHETNEVLREEWGGEYSAHKNAIKAFLDGIPEESRESFAAARLPDGTPVLSDPNILKFFLTSALEINPATTIVPAGGNQMASIEDEIHNLESQMGNRNSEYWKRPDLQERYRKLVEARDKMK